MGRWTDRSAEWLEARLIEVRLPRERRAVFPLRCIACAREPDQEVTISSRGSSSPAILTGSQLTRLRHVLAPKFSVCAPVCVACAPRVRRRHRWGSRLYWAPLYAGVLLYGYARFTDQPWIAYPIPIGIALTVALLLYEFIHPEALALTDTGAIIRYEFASRTVAQRFAELNETTIHNT